MANLQKPPVKLNQSLCYSQSSTFCGNETTKWGKDSENRVVMGLYKLLITIHTVLEILPTGLFISLFEPWLAASPDALISCSCHGPGVVEVKCPHKHKDTTISRAVEIDPEFPLSKDECANYYLKKSHVYFYQIQLQMYVIQRGYGMFVVYTKCDLVFVKIPFDEALFQSVIPHCKLFFREHLLPELLAKVTTTPVINKPETPPHLPADDTIRPVTSSQTLADNSVNNYFPCICQKVTSDEIISCTKVNCFIKQYHKRCTGLKRFPPNWTCKPCQEKQNRNKAREKAASKRENEHVSTLPQICATPAPVIDSQTDSSIPDSVKYQTRVYRKKENDQTLSQRKPLAVLNK